MLHRFLSRAPRRALLLATALALGITDAAVAGPDAAGVIGSFHEALLVSMKAGSTAGCAGRAKGLSPAIDADFDFPYLAQRVLRRRWSGLDDTQRQQFTALFHELVVTTYAGNFSNYSGEKFSAPAAQAMPDGTQLVKTQLITAKGEAVELDYVLRQTDSQWRVVNIIAEGVSNLALWSSQYDKVFQDQGFDGLMKQLRTQVDKAKADC